MYLNMCWPNSSHVTDETKCTSKCVDETHPMPARTRKASQNVLTKPVPCQREHKIYLNLCWTNLSHGNEDTKYISTCVEQTYLMPGRTQNISQLVLTKPLLCHRGYKMHLSMCFMPARKKHLSQLVLKTPIPCQRGHKIYLKLCWSNQQRQIVSTCVDQIPN